jgi:hypothetical protein
MDDINQIFDKLILDGAIEVSSIDSATGEFLYNFTHKMKEVSPALYHEHMNNVNEEIMYFWEKGFLVMNDVTSKNPIIRLSSKAFDDKEISILPLDKQVVLQDIKRILKVV